MLFSLSGIFKTSQNFGIGKIDHTSKLEPLKKTYNPIPHTKDKMAKAKYSLLKGGKFIFNMHGRIWLISILMNPILQKAKCQ